MRHVPPVRGSSVHVRFGSAIRPGPSPPSGSTPVPDPVADRRSRPRAAGPTRRRRGRSSIGRRGSETVPTGPIVDWAPWVRDRADGADRRLSPVGPRPCRRGRSSIARGRSDPANAIRSSVATSREPARAHAHGPCRSRVAQARRRLSQPALLTRSFHESGPGLRASVGRGGGPACRASTARQALSHRRRPGPCGRQTERRPRGHGASGGPSPGSGGTRPSSR